MLGEPVTLTLETSIGGLWHRLSACRYGRRTRGKGMPRELGGHSASMYQFAEW